MRKVMAQQQAISLFGRSTPFYDLNSVEINSYASSTSSYLITYGLGVGNPRDVAYSSSNDVTNMIGVEGKYFVTSEIAARLSFSGAFDGSPSRDFTEGVDDPTGEYYPNTYLPPYKMKEGYSRQRFFLDLGADYYLPSNYERVAPYAGVQFNTIYGKMEVFDGFRGLKNNEVIATFAKRNGVGYSIGGSIVAGIDYYLSESMLLGIEIKALSYFYSVKKVYSQPGIKPQISDSHNTSYFASPTLKIGFRF